MYTYNNQKSKWLFWDIEDYLKQIKVYDTSDYVKLANQINRDELCEPIEKAYCKNNWRPSINIRMMVSLEILKHLLKLSDEKLVKQLQTNIEVKYFCGVSNINDNTSIEPSSLTHFRNRLTQFPEILEKIEKVMLVESIKRLPKKKQWQYDQDSTVIEENVAYPNDVDLLSQLIEKTSSIANKAKQTGIKSLQWIVVKWKRIAKKMKTKYHFATGKKKKELLETTKKWLYKIAIECERLIKTIRNKIRSQKNTKTKKKLKKELNYYLKVWKEILKQQWEMIKNKTNKVKNRIISYSKPYLRPIVKWKKGKKVQYGAKAQIWMIWWKVAVAVGYTWDNEHDWKWIKKWLEKVENVRWKSPGELWYDKWWRNQEAYEYLSEKGITNGIQGSKGRNELPKNTKKRLYKRRAFNENIINDVLNHRWVNKRWYRKENTSINLIFGCISSNLVRVW